MKKIAAIFGLCSMPLALFAEQGKLPPLPTGPLLKRAPDYAVWSVAIKGCPLEDSASRDAASKHALTLAQSDVTKTGSIILERNTDSNGTAKDIWHYKGIQVTKEPGSQEPFVFPDSGGGGDIYSVDFSAGDFAGLNWISPSTYAGIEKYKGRDCIVFKSYVSPLTAAIQRTQAAAISDARGEGQAAPDEIKVPALAYIDLETRLPIYVQFGGEKRTYGYGAPPQSQLTLPADLMAALKQYALRLSRLSAPPSRPY